MPGPTTPTRTSTSSLSGRVAIVTGAGSGIGRAVARLYGERGARVVVSDIGEEAGRETVRMIGEAGGAALFVHADVSRAEHCRAVADAALSEQSCAYVSAKHGVIGLTKSAAIEYATRGIRVNAVGPAFIRTPMISALEDDAGMRDMLVDLHPMGRLGESEEVAELVAFLSSDAASFMTGGYYPVDGDTWLADDPHAALPFLLREGARGWAWGRAGNKTSWLAGSQGEFITGRCSCPKCCGSRMPGMRAPARRRRR